MMQDEVNKIVFNALADGREIWFPGVGSLVPEFRSAWRASARQLERPSRRIAFLLSEQRGVSVIDLIARAGACDVAAAEDIYSRWLDKARVEDGISIPGVGELNHRYFRLDSQLDAVLNPLGHDPLPLKRRYSRLPLYLGIALFCTAAVGYGIWQYGEWMRLPFVGDSEKQEVLPVAEVVSSVPARTGSETPEATGGDAESGAIDSEPVAESRPVETSQDDEAAGVETLSEGATGAGRADLDADYEAPVPEVARMIPGRTYVVWGVYSTEENARRAVAEARARLSDTNFRIYFFGKKWMVSVFESDSAAECRDFMRNAGAGLKEVWPYTKNDDFCTDPAACDRLVLSAPFFLCDIRNGFPLRGLRCDHAVRGCGQLCPDLSFLVAGRYFDLGFVVMSPHIASLVLVFPITFFTGFWLNRYVAFRTLPVAAGKQLGRYLLTVVGSILLNYACMKFLVEVCGLWPTPSKCITSLAVALYSYLAARYYTFKGISSVK